MIERLLERYDPQVFELGRDEARLRLEGLAEEPIDVVLTDAGEARTADVEGRPDAILRADEATWRQLVDDPRGGMDAFRSGRLKIRHDLHLGIGFLAATAPNGGGLRFVRVDTAEGVISTMEAGEGPPVVLLHGLGATKASFLPTVAALAREHRAIAIDLPGFGDSDKPLSGAYDARFFAEAVVALLDTLGYERAHLVGNSMGGRVAIEVGLRAPDRVGGARAAGAVAGLAARSPVGAAAAARAPAARSDPARAARARRGDRRPGDRRGPVAVDRGGRRRVPALLPDAGGAHGVLRRGTQHLPRGAARRRRVLDAAAGADAAVALRVGPAGHARADQVRRARAARAAGGRAPGARLRACAAARSATPHARRVAGVVRAPPALRGSAP